MIFAELLVFSLALLGCGIILFILIYYIIMLTDLECDYVNAWECCQNMNNWKLPKYITHTFITFLFLMHAYFYLFAINFPMYIWLTYHYFVIPKGYIATYDPAEIHNRGQLKKYMHEILAHIVYYLVTFFIYLYCFILSIMKGNPIPRQSDDEIVSQL